MVQIPGLYPIGPSAASQERISLRGRVAAPDAAQLRPSIAQPVASPVDTYVRPEVDGTNDDMSRLAAALADFNPSLKAFAKARQGTPEDARAKALKALQTADPVTLKEQVKSGAIPELQTLEGLKVFGEHQAYRDAAELTRLYNEEFDKEGGNVDALFQQIVDKTYAEYGQDPAFLDTYAPVMQKTWENLRGVHADAQTEAEMTRRKDTVFSTWYNRVDFQMADGKTPAEIATGLFDDIPNNRDFLRLHPKEQQQMLLTLADQQATKGNFDVAKAIIEMERVDGGYRGSLLSDRDTSESAVRLMERIVGDEQRAFLQDQSVEAEAQLDAQILDQVNRGVILSTTDATIPGPDGKPKTITPQEQQKRAASLIVTQVQEEVTRRNMTSEQAKAFEKQAFVGSGLEHPQWFTAMNGSYTQMSMNSATSTSVPPEALESFKTYRELSADSPLYLAKHLTPKAGDFYETASVLLETGVVKDEAAALQQAQAITSTIDSNDPLLQQRYEAIDAAIEEVVDGSGRWGLWGIRSGIPNAVNVAEVRTDLVRTAKIFARAGLSNDEAMTRATELYKKSHVNVAGWYIPADKRMPPDFAPLVDQSLQSFTDKYGAEEGFDVGDLTIRPAGKGSGAYYIVLRSNPSYPLGTVQDRSVSFDSIARLRESNRNTVISDVVNNSQAAPDTTPAYGNLGDTLIAP